jgi:uncharacterized protein YqeY
MLIDKLKDDLKESMLSKDESKRNMLRVVIGEVQRLNKKAGEKPTDKEVEGVIKHLIESVAETLETKVLKLGGAKKEDHEYLKLLRRCLPPLMTEEEIIDWLSKNDGKSVKEILSKVKYS